MGHIRKMGRLNQDFLDGTEVYKMCPSARAGQPQEVLVVCAPKAVIKPHSHAVDAEMFIVAGKARVLSGDPSLHGHLVCPGDIVFFERNVMHGFEALEEGLTFVSRNGGIADDDGTWDMRFAS
jgi:quercetin dioxygenase-like cupin family protein